MRVRERRRQVQVLRWRGVPWARHARRPPEGRCAVRRCLLQNEVAHAEVGEEETKVRQSVNQLKALQRKKRTEGVKKKHQSSVAENVE